MATPLPFTFSSLDTFANCPRRYHEQYVLKSVKDEPGAQAIYGTNVHAEFEKYVNATGDYQLPDDLTKHKPKLDQLLAKDGIFWCEVKVAFDKTGKPCHYDSPDRLWRGNIDFRLIDRFEKSATICDYKTGKPHDKWTQPAQYALQTFAEFPHLEIVNAQFYWTQTATTTKKVWGRQDIPKLWGYFIGDLKQYKEAFKTDTWQERPSGLCYGWCSVKNCKHWKPHKPGRG